MGLSSDLISQFVKATKITPDTKKETTVHGTTVIRDGKTYVKLDGSDLLTPVTSTVTPRENERVTVSIKNHSGTINGNVSAPAARNDDVEEIENTITTLDILVANKVSVGDFDAETATIRGQLNAAEAEIDSLVASDVTINGQLVAIDALIDTLKTTKLDAEVADITYATIEELDATTINVRSLNADLADFESVTAQDFLAVYGTIDSLGTKYADIDFANISEATMVKFYANSGLIKDATINNATITGHLSGVYISGDYIEAGTVKADKLVLLGDDGLYYKINTNGTVTEADQNDLNSINGRVITAKSINATKISVTDLEAFGATIGGYHITESSIYSGSKSSATNTTRGAYFDNTGQVAFGDATNFVKFYKDSNGKYKLAISADEFVFSSSGKSVDDTISDAVDNIQVGGRNLIIDSTKEFSNNDYLTASYAPSTPMVAGEKYTMTLCLTPASGAHYVPHVSNGYQAFTEFRPTGTDKQIVSVTFTAKYYTGRTPSDNIRYADIGIYRMPNNGTVTGKTTVHWAKLEKGNKATDWTPAPEDVADDISTAQNTANTANTAAGNAQTAANNAATKADNAQSAASTAQSTANTAKSTAESVQSDLSTNYTKKTLPDTRSDNQNPGWYITNYPRQIITEFKLTTAIGLTGEMFCTLTTTVPWANNSGGYPKQVAKVGSKEYWRVGTSDTAWGSWNDAIGKAEAAAKTATNYMKFKSGEGLTIGDMTASTLGRNVLIDSDSVDIRNGTNVLASYRDNAILLGVNSPTSIIDLCSGTGSITSSALSDGIDWWKLDISSQNSIGLYPGYEFEVSSYFESTSGDSTSAMIRANTATPWTLNPDVYGIDARNNGCITLYSSIMNTATYGYNEQRIDMNGADGIVIHQHSEPIDMDSQSASIAVKASSQAGKQEPSSIILSAMSTKVTGDLIFTTNNERIWGTCTDGTEVEIFQAKNSSNNTVIGWGNYNAAAGNTNVYGNGILMRANNDISIRSDGGNAILRSDKSGGYAKVYGDEVYIQPTATSTGESYRPYYHGVDSIAKITFRGAGYVTNAGKDIYFIVPLAKPIVGVPTASITSSAGFILRQDAKYTHGSASSTYVKPTKYAATVDDSGNYVRIAASFTTTTNVVNNSPIGIDWTGKITFAYG